MKKHVLIGMTLVLGLLSAPLASQASLGNSDAAPYQQGQQKRVAKAKPSSKSSARPARQARKSSTKSNKSLGELPKIASCSKKSGVSMFADTAHKVASNTTVAPGKARAGVN